MKKFCILLSVLITAISCSHAQKTEFSNEALGTKLMAIDGQEITFKDILSRYKGKTVMIEVWASWCSDCVKAMPKVKTLQAANPDIAYLFISVDKTPESWKAGIEKHGLKGDHFLATDGMKGKFGKSIDLDWIPRYVVIGKNGKILLYRAIETDFDKIDATLKSTM